MPGISRASACPALSHRRLTSGDRPIALITRAELLTLLRRIQDRSAIETVLRARGEIGRVFRFAMQDDRATVDPTAVLRGSLKAAETEHFPAILDPKPWGNCCGPWTAGRSGLGEGAADKFPAGRKVCRIAMDLALTTIWSCDFI